MFYAVILLSVTFNASAQIMLRLAMVGFNGTTAEPMVARMVGLMFSPYLIGGLALFCVSIVSWLVVLSRLPVGIAYPMASLGYIAAACLGYLFLKEPVSWTQIGGIGLICLGVALIGFGRSKFG